MVDFSRTIIDELQTEIDNLHSRETHLLTMLQQQLAIVALDIDLDPIELGWGSKQFRPQFQQIQRLRQRRERAEFLLANYIRKAQADIVRSSWEPLFVSQTHPKIPSVDSSETKALSLLFDTRQITRSC